MTAQFEAQADRNPTAPALLYGHSQLSFGELNKRANRLAHRLIEQRVRPGDLVGISMPRSMPMVVAILATLKAGAAYLPLDPGLPSARYAAILKDAAPVTVLKEEPASTAGYPETNPGLSLSLTHTAYVIYTSGSTGMPKGVMIRHREFSNYLAWAGTLYETSSGCGAPVNTPLAFDATVTSLWLPLAAGKPVFLLPEENHLEALAELLISGREFTLVKLTPAHLTALAELLGPKAALVRARNFVVGGEALPGDVANFWTSRVSGLRIVNEYGPTETVVGCCVHGLANGEQVAGDVPIGVPAGNNRLYVLDAALEPAPPNIWGELYIGGPQLGIGYLHRPGLTAERFVVDPFSSVPGARMYRSGDSVRWRLDGILEFRGRVDNQIKIRGFRIEPGEIESILTAEPTIAQAAVIPSQDAQGTRLLAFVVPRAGSPGADPEVWHRILSERLPEYMVPSAIFALDALPLTPNGKIDRRALLASCPATTASRDIALPHSPNERLVAGIWQHVLGLDPFDINNRFNSLGGNSLLMIRVLARLREAVPVPITMVDLFRYPTVSTLGAYLDSLTAPAAKNHEEEEQRKIRERADKQRMAFRRRT